MIEAEIEGLLQIIQCLLRIVGVFQQRLPIADQVNLTAVAVSLDPWFQKLVDLVQLLGIL